MYHCIINLNIYSDNLLLENTLKKVRVLNEFEYQIKTHRIINRELEKSDIILLDLSWNSEIRNDILKVKSKEAIVILSILPEEYAILSSMDKKIADHVWLKPLDEEMIEFNFIKIQNEIKFKMDFWLNQQYLDTVIDSIPDLVWFKDIKGEHLKVNNSFCRAVGKPKDDIQGRGHYYIWDLKREEYEKGEYVCLESDEIVLKLQKTCLFDEKVKSKEGLRRFKTYKSPIFNHHGEPIGTVGVAQDITDLQNVNAELETVLENMPFAILIHNKMGTVINVNRKFSEFFGINKNDIINSEYISWELSVFKESSDIKKEGLFTRKLFIDHEEKTIEVNKEIIYDTFDNFSGYLYIYRDITMDQKIQKEILHIANTDYLTGLFNRRYLYEYLNEYRYDNQMCLFYIDIDNFKQVNDTYGHETGDNALIYLSIIIRRFFPNQNIFRLGGDEFLVTILECPDQNMLKERAQELLDVIRSRIQFVDKFKMLSASIGIVMDSDTSVDLDVLLKRGDSALYLAKQRGKNQYCMWEED